MLQLIFKDDFVYYETSKNIYSTFYVIVNNTTFPDNGWHDFPILALNMWNENIIKNNYKKRCKFKLFFMDGPFYIECYKEGSNVSLRFINNKISPIEILTFQTTFSELKDSIYNGSTQFINIISKREFGYLNELEKLQKTIKIIENLV